MFLRCFANEDPPELTDEDNFQQEQNQSEQLEPI